LTRPYPVDDTPVEFWPTASIRAALQSGDITVWQRIVVAIKRDPYGRTARQVEEVLESSAPYGVSQALTEVLIRARAIENGCYLVAPAQVGKFPPGNWCYGRSMVVDPWGTVVATAPDTEGVIVADLDRERVRQVRRQVPSLANRRPAAYAWPEPVATR